MIGRRSLCGAKAVFLLSLLCCVHAHAAVIYVNKNCTGSVHDGAAWATAFTTVRAAVDAASAGDEIWVAASSPAAPAYIENSIPITKSGVSLYGGFRGAETQRSQRDWKTNATILDSGQQSTVVSVLYPTTSSVTIDGFTIRNGNYGSGVCLYGASATVSNNTIVKNSGDGIYVESGTATLTNNIISDNYGNGVNLEVGVGLVRIENNSISGNSGNGVSVSGSASASLIGNTITSNNGGVQVGGTVSVANSVVAFNGGFGINKAKVGSLLACTHNDVFGNTDGEFSGYTPPADQGNIGVDPKLSSVYRDVHLQPDSPCLDAGEDGQASVTTDIDGQARIQGAHVDIGSDESDGTAWSVPSRIWFVSTSGNDASDGLSWSSAKKTLSGATVVATGGDEIWVAKGTYQGWAIIPAGVGIYGGFGGAETDRNGRSVTANASILDGGGGKHSVIYCVCPNSVLDGFTIRNGYYGVSVASSYAALRNNTICGNSMSGVLVNNGRASTQAELVCNTMFANAKGGIDVQSGRASLRNNSIVGNSGDGITVHGAPAALSMENGIVAFNSGYGVTDMGASMPVFSHNDVFGNTTGGYTGFTPPSDQGNISTDPLFADRSASDYHLQAASPCIDTGDDSVLPPGETDLDGRPRRLGAHVDMGAYEYPVSGYFTLADVAIALRAAGGLSTPDAASLSRLNVATDGASVSELDLLDAIRLTGKATGLDANP